MNIYFKVGSDNVQIVGYQVASRQQLVRGI